MTGASSSTRIRLRNPAWLPILLPLVILVLLMAWFVSRPVWEISAHNTPQGVVVEVYRSGASKPTYQTLLAGEKIEAEFERQSRRELNPDFAKTTFVDDTLRPGRWTVVVGETEIDIMERGMIVNGGTTITPTK